MVYLNGLNLYSDQGKLYQLALLFADIQDYIFDNHGLQYHVNNEWDILITPYETIEDSGLKPLVSIKLFCLNPELCTNVKNTNVPSFVRRQI